MLQQQSEDCNGVEVERPVQRIAAADARAVFQEQARARDIVHGVVKGLAVVWIRPALEQQLGELHIVIHPDGAVERRQRIFVVGVCYGGRGPPIADPLVGVCAGRKQKLRAAVKTRAKFRHLQQG